MDPTEKTVSRNESEHGPAAPSISLPKGGGAIRGIGEKLAANPVTGTGSTTIPLATSPGRSGFGPQLSLSYDSGSGNGPFGFGWSLSTPAISRKTDKGLPQYRDAEESDVYLLSGAEDLVPVYQTDQDGNVVRGPGGEPLFEERPDDGFLVRRYRPRVEGLFARIERWTRQSDGDIHWRSFSRDNVLTVYGRDAESRIADPEDPRRVFTWLIRETRDDKGNAVLYTYKPEDGADVDLTLAHERNRGNRDDPRRGANRYLKRIRYGNRVPLLDGAGQRPRELTAAQVQNAGWMFEVVFDYGEHDPDAPKPLDPGTWAWRKDPFSSYRAGFEVRTGRLCQRVLMFHHFPAEPEVGDDCLVRSTDFTYSHELDPASVRNPVYTFLLAVTQTGYRRKVGGGYLDRSLPPVEYEYTQPVVRDTVEEVDAASLENLPAGVDGAAYQWTDLHGEGIPGILTEQAGAWFYRRNISPISERPVEFAPLELVAAKPNLALAGGRAQFMDLAGDGQPDLVVLDGPMPGLYEHDGGEGWQPFRPFTSRLQRDTRDPNLKLVDLDGDGHADVLISEGDAFVWHASLAEEGFGPAVRVPQAFDEEKGPRLVFADGEQSIHLADLSGDGLTDLLRIRNGEVCYWPNLGYGRFGAKVTMDQAPWFDHPDQFDPRRLRLADIDGSGTTDIIYLHRDGVRLYFNQSGNGWSAPQALRVFPRVDDLASIVPADLLGNGTACLVWSSSLPGDARRPLRYVDLMGGRKPHLLVGTRNNLGAETRLEYASSTRFYLRDKWDGRPWITKLAFPVHVVERVETRDHVSGNRFLTRYAYHHGYFDGEEREFRGFGMVEQWDTEEFAVLPGATNVDPASHVPPVYTRTWFHTGVYLGRDHISSVFAGEYYREQHPLADTVLPASLTIEEEREACRALKGAMLRQEVYALDGTGTPENPFGHPYVVTEQNFTLRRLQPREGNRHAVFFSHPREAVKYHYERDLTDPRVSHGITLEVDRYGNTLKELAVGYGRRVASTDPALTADDKTKQTRLLITFTQNRHTQAVLDADHYRTPLSAETRTYELTGFKPGNNAIRFSFEEALALPAAATEIPYEKIADHTAKQKRLIE
ncbi:MAG TPA: SpvB/TcaC N-terminal domain-containing protein, partial [Thermoanaerobaculia bacterium]